MNVDLDAATGRGVLVVYTPGRNAEAVADFVIGQLIALVRHIGETNHLLRSGALTERREERVRPRRDVTWRPADPAQPVPYHTYRGPELWTLTLGLLGLGHVGRRVAAKATALGMRVLAHDPYVRPQDARDATLVGLDELLDSSDVLSLHARGDRPLIGARELRRLRRGAYVINTARAAILDTGALVDALRDGHLGGAALDVFEDEPLVPDDPLLAFDNVLLTPHIAGASANVVEHQSRALVETLRALDAGGDLHDIAVANPAALDGAAAQWVR